MFPWEEGLTLVRQVLPVAWHLYWPSVLLVFGVWVLEQWRPVERNQPVRPLLFNLAWHALFLAVFFVLAMSVWGQWIDALTRLFGKPLWAAPSGLLEQALRMLLALLVQDCLVYWGHRLMHAVPFLWSIHQMHHDERHLNASTSLRQHWLSIPVHQFVVFMPIAWLFGAEALPAAAFWASALAGALHHANLRVDLGWLTPWIVGPQVHRIHHARSREMHDRNFASLFPVWDILFGTWQRPQPGQFEDVGLDAVAPSHRLLPTLVQPVIDWFRPRRVADR